ncbi:MAG: RagB/SusD family nutrient uptake outer membrane protein [Prevotella sp.]|nr:RagB/SusD family nutrient uptake outer membrane protein [Prevotella sp.]
MITKIYKKSSLLVGAALVTFHLSLFTSCSDQLELAPQGEFTADQLTDESIEGLMSSAYQGLEAHFFEDNNAAFAGPITNWVFDVRSDDAYKGGEGVSMEANIHQLEISNISSDNATCLNKWENNYLGIARVHKAMLAIQDAGSVSDKESLLGELKTLRAWYYFDLNRIFKSIPYFTENDDPKTVTNGNLSRDEIYSTIKADLEEAYDVMPETQSQPGRFTKYVAAALLCKVNAQTATWSEVEKWADVVINSGKYELYDNFADMSKLEFNNRKESIMAIQFSTANENIHVNFCNLLNTTRSEGNIFGSGDDFFLASQNLVNAFRTDANGLPYLDGTFNSVRVTSDYQGSVDPRLDFTVGRIGYPFRGYTYTEGWCRDYNTYGEYSGKKGLIDPNSSDMVQGFPWGASGLNFMLIRYADILLLKAEALVEQATGTNAATDEGLVEARNIVNQIRQKAARSIDGNYYPVDLDPAKADYYVGLYPTDWDGNLYWTKDRARMAVRMERRLELAMEGQRWFDLLRWGTAVETVNKYMQEEASLRPYYAGASVTEDELYLPIPISQIENSNGLYK